MSTSQDAVSAPTFTLRHGRIPDHLIDFEEYEPDRPGAEPFGWWVSDIDADAFDDLYPASVESGRDQAIEDVRWAQSYFAQIVTSAARRALGYGYELQVAGWTPVPGGDAEQAHVPTFKRVDNYVRITSADGTDWDFNHLSITEVDALRSDFYAGEVLTVNMPRTAEWTEVKRTHRKYFRNPTHLDHQVFHHSVELSALLSAADGKVV